MLSLLEEPEREVGESRRGEIWKEWDREHVRGREESE